MDKTENKLQNLPTEGLVLVVEDDDTSYYFIDILLSKNNFKVIRVKDGIEAVEIFTKNVGINLILMDLIIPGIDGYEATRQIRMHNKGVPIIAQTASVFEGGKEKAIQAGCNDYITKPLQKNELLGKIYMLLNVKMDDTNF